MTRGMMLYLCLTPVLLKDFASHAGALIWRLPFIIASRLTGVTDIDLDDAALCQPG
jgi:hypothetical protein